MTKIFRQFKLKSANRELICWLEDDKRLYEGIKITLDDLKFKGIIWKIVYRSVTIMHGKPTLEWKVGGII